MNLPADFRDPTTAEGFPEFPGSVVAGCLYADALGVAFLTLHRCLFGMDFLEQGGAVMWVLLVVSLFGFIVFIERTLFLHKSQIRTNDFLTGIRNLLEKGRLMEALTVCEETPGPVGNVIKSGLLRAEDPEARIRGAMQEAALVEIPILERRIGTLAVIARIAPILGIIGTLLGLGEAFTEMFVGEAVAYPRFTELAGGLAQALHTTIFGLVIAVMAHLAHHFLAGRVRVLVHDMEYAGNHILQFLHGEGSRDP